MLTQSWKFEWMEGREMVSAPDFLARWQGLVNRSPAAGAFQEPVMVRAWIATKGAALKHVPMFCWASNDQGHEVLMALCLEPPGWHNAWQRRLVAVGQPYFDYQDPVAATPDGMPVDWAGFWPGLATESKRRGYEQIELPRLRARADSGIGRSASAGQAFYIPLDGFKDLDAYLKSRPRRHAVDIRRRERRLKEQGEVELQVYQPQEREAAAAELWRLRAAYENLWAGQPRGNLFRQPGTFEFYQRLLDWALPCGLAHFSVLRVGGCPMSWVLGFLHRGVLLCHTICYSLEHAALSPGKMQWPYLIELGLQSGWKEIDLGHGTEDYKSLWTDTARPLVQWQWRTGSLRGQFWRCAQQVARPMWRSLATGRPKGRSHV